MIRPYQHKDQEQVLHLLRLNTPQYFAPEEEKDFIDYLHQAADHYFVVSKNEQIVGCGGYNFIDDRAIARISWDIIHPDFQGQGIGKQLTEYRIAAIKNNSSIQLIQVRTTQLVFPFYKKLGFELEKVTKDFWAAGFDLYQMNMVVNV